MGIGSIIITVLGLCFFEIISRTEKTVINDEILGVMYFIFALGVMTMASSSGVHTPLHASPLLVFAIIGYFVVKSINKNKMDLAL